QAAAGAGADAVAYTTLFRSPLRSGSRERYVVDSGWLLRDRLASDRSNAKRRRPGDEDGTRRVTNERRLRGAIERDGVRLDPDPARRAAVLIGPAVVSAGLAAIVVGVNASAVGIQAAVTLHACSHQTDCSTGAASPLATCTGSCESATITTIRVDGSGYRKRSRSSNQDRAAT